MASIDQPLKEFARLIADIAFLSVAMAILVLLARAAISGGCQDFSPPRAPLLLSSSMIIRTRSAYSGRVVRVTISEYSSRRSLVDLAESSCNMSQGSFRHGRPEGDRAHAVSKRMSPQRVLGDVGYSLRARRGPRLGDKLGFPRISRTGRRAIRYFSAVPGADVDR
jgi:hypothetical protein